MSEELVAYGVWDSGVGAPLSNTTGIGGPGFVLIPDAATCGCITSASGQLYTGPNEALPSSVPEPSSFILLVSGIAGLSALGRKRLLSTARR